jgi:hypothetical protein
MLTPVPPEATLRKYPRAVAALLYGRTDEEFIVDRVVRFMEPSPEIRAYTGGMREAIHIALAEEGVESLGRNAEFALGIAGYESIHPNATARTETGRDADEFLLLTLMSICYTEPGESLGVQNGLIGLAGYALRSRRQAILPLLFGATCDAMLVHWEWYLAEALYAQVAVAEAAHLPAAAIEGIRALLRSAGQRMVHLAPWEIVRECQAEHRLRHAEFADTLQVLWPHEDLEGSLALVQAEWERIHLWLKPLSSGPEGVAQVLGSKPAGRPLAESVCLEPWAGDRSDQTVALLLPQGRQLHETQSWSQARQRAALQLAATCGRGDVVRQLIPEVREPHGPDADGLTALHRAAGWGHADIAEALLGAGADPNARDNDGETPLHAAASEGHAEIEQLLLASGADVNARNHGGQTPLHKAAIQWRVLWQWTSRSVPMPKIKVTDEEVAAILQRRQGGEPSGDSDQPVSEFSVQMSQRTQEVLGRAVQSVEVLLKAGADVNAVDGYGRTPLHYGVERGGPDLIRALVCHGADTNAKDPSGATPVDRAEARGLGWWFEGLT